MTDDGATPRTVEAPTGFLIDRLPEYMANPSPHDAAVGEVPFLLRFLGIFQELADEFDAQIRGIEHVPDPTVAPPEIVRWLASWLGADDIDAALPVSRQRELARIEGWLLAYRGTATGLGRLLRLHSGTTVRVTDNGGIWEKGGAHGDAPMVWIDVDRPAMRHTAATGGSDGLAARLAQSRRQRMEQHLLAVARRELPADVAFELRIDGTMVWPAGATWSGPPAPARTNGARRRRPLHAQPVGANGGPAAGTTRGRTT